MAYATSATYLLTRLNAGLYNYNGRQIELFYMKWFKFWMSCKMPDDGSEVDGSVQTFL